MIIKIDIGFIPAIYGKKCNLSSLIQSINFSLFYLLTILYFCPILLFFYNQIPFISIIDFAKYESFRWIFLLFVVIMALASCQRTSITVEKGTLKFSNDTVKFNTIFTTMRSPSEWLIVHNPTVNNIKVGRIWLASGANSS